MPINNFPAISCSFDGSPVRRFASCRNVSQLSYSTKVSSIASRIRSGLNVACIQPFFGFDIVSLRVNWVAMPQKTKIPDSWSRGTLRLNSPPPSAARFLAYDEPCYIEMALMGDMVCQVSASRFCNSSLQRRNGGMKFETIVTLLHESKTTRVAHLFQLDPSSNLQSNTTTGPLGFELRQWRISVFWHSRWQPL
jgi:hypothetical protein